MFRQGPSSACEPSPEPSPTSSRLRSGTRIDAGVRPQNGDKPSTEHTPEPARQPRADMSVRELKEQLAVHKIDCSNCVEKKDLQDFWSRFETLCEKPLEELQASVAAAGSVPPPSTAAACAARLLGATPTSKS